MVPLEAAAAGRPPCALGGGGVRDPMIGRDDDEGPPTAVFFGEQTVDALAAAIRRFEAAADRFEPKALRARAEQFDRRLFLARVREYVDGRRGEFLARRAC